MLVIATGSRVLSKGKPSRRNIIENRKRSCYTVINDTNTVGVKHSARFAFIHKM